MKPTHRKEKVITEIQLEAIQNYFKSHPELKEVHPPLVIDKKFLKILKKHVKPIGFL